MYRPAGRVRFAVVSPDTDAKTYVTGLTAARSKTVTGIAREVLPAGSDRALNKFLTEYDWDEDQLNHERLEELQQHGETRWSQDGYIVIDDSVFQRTGKELPGAGKFYDHTEGEPVWDRISFTRSTLTTKRPIRLCFASTRRPTTRIRMTQTRRSTISPENWLRNWKKR